MTQLVTQGAPTNSQGALRVNQGVIWAGPSEVMGPSRSCLPSPFRKILCVRLSACPMRWTLIWFNMTFKVRSNILKQK